MSFSYVKSKLLKPQKEKYLSTFLIALAVAAAFFLPYMFLGKGYFIFYGDFNVQQIPFYQECHKAIREGNIFWSATTDLGANFIGSYSFYLLGSPFFWLTIPFPNSFVPYLMGPLLILKFGCAALTSYAYIRRFTRTPHSARLGGLLYAFSGFSVYNIFFNHFHEAIIAFPLLLLAFELLITENKRYYFALAVFFCAVTNYFFFFGMVVFVVIYFFVRLFSGAIKITVSRFMVLLFEAFLGLALSAVLLLPSCLAILDNSRVSSFLLGWNAIMYGKEQIYANVIQCFFFPPDIPARPVFFPEAEVKWSSLGGWLPLFSMVGVFTFFSTYKKNWLKRMIGICTFMALVPILNSAFYAFNTAYYARWFYMPILLMCLATVSLTEDSNVDWRFGYRWVLGITIAVSAVIGFFPQKNNEGKIIYGLYTQGEDNMYLFRYWIACLISIASLIIVGILIKLIKTDRKFFYRMALICVCVVTIIYANFFIGCGRSHSYEIEEVMIDQLIEGDSGLDNPTGYRIDVYDGVDNTAMYLGHSGINAFHSIVPASVFEFYDFIGIKRSVGSRPETDYYAIRPLLSVKYLLNRTGGESFVDEETAETEMPDYTYLKTYGGYYIYENENYIPYGFSYDYYMSYDTCNNYSENNKAFLMLKAILLTDEQIEKYGHLFEDLNDIDPISHFEDYRTSFSFTDEALRYDCEQLRETSAEHFEFDNKGFSATVKREKETLVFFSIPYDKGWSATVNGKSVPIEKVNAGFMAVKVDKGMSNIRFDYTTPGLLDGLAVTAISALILLLYVIIYSLWSIKHKATTSYPEGLHLLNEWKAQEEQDYIQAENQNLDENNPSILNQLNSDLNETDFEKSEDGGFIIDPDAFNS